MHGRKDGHHRLKEPLPCPRCRTPLARTNDLARGNRFLYFACPQNHGHFITFFQFLREKGIVRGLTLKELAELKRHVQWLQCSDCGGPISLEEESACPSCRAPVCILDPKALGSALEGLRPAAAVAGAVVAPSVAAQILTDKMGMDSFYRQVEARAQVAATMGPVPLATPPDELNSPSALATGLEVADAAETGFYFLEVCVDFFLDIAGEIFSKLRLNPMPSILESLPALYRNLFPSFFQGPIPEETKATCSACAMCEAANPVRIESVDGVNRFFRPASTKCCTYHPRLPNYLVVRDPLGRGPRHGRGPPAHPGEDRSRCRGESAVGQAAHSLQPALFERAAGLRPDPGAALSLLRVEWRPVHHLALPRGRVLHVVLRASTWRAPTGGSSG